MTNITNVMHTRHPIYIATSAAMLCTSLQPCMAAAPQYPNKPVRIVTSEVGGGADIIARLIAPDLSTALGQPVIVENRPSGVIPGNVVSKATPDGHTLLFISSSFWTLPFMQNVPWDPVKDFAPVTLATSSPNIVIVHPSMAAKSVPELIALAKAKPGELNYASGASGASTHLAAELFKAMAGVNIVRVPYRGNGPAFNAFLGGQTQLMFSTASVVTPHINSGKLRALAVTSTQPSALFPGLPTVAASGVPGYESGSTSGMFTPAGSPPSIVNRLHRESIQILNQPEMKRKLLATGLETVASTPAQFLSAIKLDMTRLGKVIRDAGIRAE